MNLFMRELRAHRIHLIVWSIVMIAFMFLSMGKYAALSGDAAASQQLIQTLPSTLQAVFGMTGLDLTTIQGYYGICFIFISVMLAIHAGMLGADLVSKEERDKTAEFLYVKPRERAYLLTMKLVAGVLIMLVVYIVTALATYGSIALVNNGSVPVGDLVPFSLALLLVQALFYSAGAFFASVLTHPKQATMYVSILVFVLYISDVLYGLSDQFGLFKQITPFGYFNARDILADMHLNIGYVAITASVTAVLLIVTYIGYTRRDFKI